jgi:hypothetical protein
MGDKVVFLSERRMIMALGREVLVVADVAGLVATFDAPWWGA